MFKPSSIAFTLFSLVTPAAITAQAEPIDVTLIRWPYT
jgi:hypothetical protein